MAGNFTALFQTSFTNQTTFTVTHNLDRLQIGVLIRIGNVARNDLIESVAPDPANPRRGTIITLVSQQSGIVVFVDTDFVFESIPTPENTAVLSGGTAMTADVYDPTTVAADTFARGNHTGTQTASTISDFDTEVDNNTTVQAAIHDNTAGEIAAVPLKGTPVSADVLLIEDSAAANAKKRVTIGSLPGGGSGSTIVVEEDGSIVSGGPHSTLNFVGGLTATDAGGGTADIAPVAPAYVDYYDSGTTDVGSSPTTLGLDTPRQSNALFVLATDQVTVQAGGAGDYAVRYEVSFRESDSSNREVECWLEINGTEVTATRSVGSHWDEHGLVTDNTLSRSAILTLATSDVVRLRSEVTNGSSGYTTDSGGVSLQIMSIGSNGPPGPVGPTGAGSNVIVQDDGVTVSGGPHGTLNFIDCAVADGGGGVAEITPVALFGRDYQTAVSVALSTTTSTTFQTKITLTTPSLTGTYRLGWCALVGQSNTGDKVECRLRNTTDGVTLGADPVGSGANGSRNEPKDILDRMTTAGFAEVVFSGAAKTFELQYRQQGGNTASIRNAHVEIWRVA